MIPLESKLTGLGFFIFAEFERMGLHPDNEISDDLAPDSRSGNCTPGIVIVKSAGDPNNGPDAGPAGNQVEQADEGRPFVLVGWSQASLESDIGVILLDEYSRRASQPEKAQGEKRQKQYPVQRETDVNRHFQLQR